MPAELAVDERRMPVAALLAAHPDESDNVKDMRMVCAFAFSPHHRASRTSCPRLAETRLVVASLPVLSSICWPFS
jgi:hypothetical protein